MSRMHPSIPLQKCPQGGVTGAQVINQNASNVTATGVCSTVNQTNYQNAYQNMSWNQLNYFNNYNQVSAVTSEQRTVITSRSEQFLGGFRNARQFIMPFADLRAFVIQQRNSPTYWSSM